MAEQPFSPFAQVSPDGASGAAFTPQPSPAAFGVGIGDALQNAGDTATKIALTQQGKINETVSVNATSEYSKQLGHLENQFRTNKGLNAAAVLPHFQDQVQQLQDQFAAALPNPAARLMFLRDAKSYADRSLINMDIHAGAETDAANLGALQGRVQEAQSRVVRNALTVGGTTPDFTEITQAVAQIGHSQGWSQDQTDAYLQKQTGDAMHGIIQASIASANPNGFNTTGHAREIFEHAMGLKIPGTDLPMLDGEHMAAIESTIQSKAYTDSIREATAQQKAQAASEKATAGIRWNVEQNVSNGMAMVQSGVAPPTMPSAAEIKAAYPNNPDRAAEMTQYTSDIQKSGALIARMPDMSPTEIAATTAQLKPDANDASTFAEKARLFGIWTKAVTGYQKRLTDDPAGTVLQHQPEVAADWTGAAQDPTKFPQYAATVQAAQDAAGVPKNQQSLMPASVASSIVNSVLSQPPAARAGAITKMATDYGQYYPQIIGDLVKAGLPTQYETLAAVSSAPVRIALADAIGQGGEKIKGAIGQSSAKIIDDYLNSDLYKGSLSDLAKTMSHLPGASQKMDGISSSIRMAAYRMALDGDPSTAIKTAIASVTTDKYDFMDDGGWRAPKGQGNMIETGANGLLANLDPHALAPLSNPAKVPYTDDELRQAALTVAQNGRWVTNARENGLLRLDVNGNPIMRADGTPLEIPFTDAVAWRPASRFDHVGRSGARP